MKKLAFTAILALGLLLVAPLSSEAGRAHGHAGKYHHKPHYHGGGGHHGAWRSHRVFWGARPYWGFRFYWGGPVVVGPPWYPYGYYAPPAVVIRQPTPVYVQPEQRSEAYWYYCQDPPGYYPYVKSCPGGWMKVVPQPTPPEP